jgi:hypothetical protein
MKQKKNPQVLRLWAGARGANIFQKNDFLQSTFSGTLFPNLANSKRSEKKYQRFAFAARSNPAIIPTRGVIGGSGDLVAAGAGVAGTLVVSCGVSRVSMAAGVPAVIVVTGAAEDVRFRKTVSLPYWLETLRWTSYVPSFM